MLHLVGIIVAVGLLKSDGIIAVFDNFRWDKFKHIFLQKQKQYKVSIMSIT